MVLGGIAKGAKTFILVVLISSIAAAIMMMMIWSNPAFIELLVKGNYTFIFSTFLTCWLLASVLAWLLVFCITRGTGGSVPQAMS